MRLLTRQHTFLARKCYVCRFVYTPLSTTHFRSSAVSCLAKNRWTCQPHVVRSMLLKRGWVLAAPFYFHFVYLVRLIMSALMRPNERVALRQAFVSLGFCLRPRPVGCLFSQRELSRETCNHVENVLCVLSLRPV